MKNKIITIEGTDCSGKQTQSDLLVKKLAEKNISIYKTSFPNYDTPTGRIIGECCLGKKIGHSFFPEESANVDPKVMGLYYAADRLYNISKIEEALKEQSVILDRYVDSNLAHQGGKVQDEKGSDFAVKSRAARQRKNVFGTAPDGQGMYAELRNDKHKRIFVFRHVT